MMRGSRKERIEIGERIGVTAEPRARGAAIKESIAMRGIAREHGVVTGNGFLGAVERVQSIAAIEQRLLSRPAAAPAPCRDARALRRRA